MLIPQQLRQAREEAGLSQAQLAARTGLSRNQIVRAETGQNITMETLQKIVTHLPVDELTLMDRVKIKMDYLNPAERMFFGIAETLASLTVATHSALKLAMEARVVLELARLAEAQQLGEERPEPDVETEILLKKIEASLQTVTGMQATIFKVTRRAKDDEPKAEDSVPNPDQSANEGEAGGQSPEGS